MIREPVHDEGSLLQPQSSSLSEIFMGQHHHDQQVNLFDVPSSVPLEFLNPKPMNFLPRFSNSQQDPSFLIFDNHHGDEYQDLEGFIRKDKTYEEKIPSY
jgi:hypothetical protein